MTREPAFYLRLLRTELDAFRATLGGDLDAPVAHCAPWTLRDLAGHLGSGNLWVVTAIAEGRGDHHPAAPEGDAALRAWYEESAAALLAALDTDPATPAWTFVAPHTVGFWQRRRAQETLIHRWDAQHALGAGQPPGPEPAADGIAEVVEVMAPRMVERGLAPVPERALRLVADDLGRSWTYGPGEPVATLSGPAGLLLLLLWGRAADAAPGLEWRGDRAAGRRVLAGPLTP
ncbi:maleylpyruvate isomerase family mycothiol-dependent enzyme [Streptomyces sp. NPDC059853]|uniref:maleylpyruvate isomerase family mycothiol-dependent enzyme n=1 Tax=Streptomyces sp. NPDC059853 TaxID=3346973 RepID=UPI003650DBE6